MFVRGVAGTLGVSKYVCMCSYVFLDAARMAVSYDRVGVEVSFKSKSFDGNEKKFRDVCKGLRS